MEDHNYLKVDFEKLLVENKNFQMTMKNLFLN